MKIQRLAAISAAVALPALTAPLALWAPSASAAGGIPSNCNPLKPIFAKYFTVEKVKTEHLGSSSTDCLFTLAHNALASMNMETGGASLYNEVRSTSASMFKVVNVSGVGKKAFAAFTGKTFAGMDALTNSNDIYALTASLSLSNATALMKAAIQVG